MKVVDKKNIDSGRCDMCRGKLTRGDPTIRCMKCRYLYGDKV